jgi:iron complex outermembrane receptor protein
VRIVTLAMTGLSIVGVAIADPAVAAMRKSTNIPAQPLAAALEMLAEQRDYQILYRSDLVERLTTRGTAGEMTVDQALDELLRGTGLTWRYLDEGAVTIVPAGPSPAPRHERTSLVAEPAAIHLASRTSPAGQADTAAGQGAEPTAAASSLDTITVTGSRVRKQLNDVTTSISVVDERELAEQFQMNPDVLAALNVTVPGLNVSRGDRIGCGMNIRGRPANFQINGIPVNQELSSSYCNAMYQVSPYALERIEVVRGATALYGAGAPGGVVNLLTRRAAGADLEIDGAVRLSGNSHGFSDTEDFDAYLGAGQRRDAWDYYAGLAYQDLGAGHTPRGGLVPRQELTSWGMNGTLGRSFGEGRSLRFTGTYYREDRGRTYAVDGTQTVGHFAPVIPIATNPFNDENFDELVTFIAAYEQEAFLGHGLQVSAYALTKEDRHFSNFYSAAWGDFFFNLHTEQDKHGLRTTLSRTFAPAGRTLELQYGFDYMSDSMYEVELDYVNATEPVWFFVPEVELRTTSGFAQSDLVLGATRISAGVRYESYRGEVGSRNYDPAIPNAAVPGDFEDSDLVLLNVGFVRDLTDRLQLYGGFSQGAALTQIGRALRGLQNPGNLSPEPATSDQYEMGIRGGVGPTEMSFAAFHSESSKGSLLQPDPSCAGQMICQLIPLRTPQRFKGFEATFDWKVAPGFETGAVLTYQRGKIYNAAMGGFIDYSSDTVSPGRLTVHAEVEPVVGWRTRLQGTYFDEASFFTPSQQALGFINTDSIFLMDLSSSYEVGPGELTLGVSNLLDKEYVDVKSQAWGDFAYTMEEGRRVSLGYRIRL